jgi:hypothetical protein
MRAKLKIILVTVLCTTIGWVAIIAGLVFLWPGTGTQMALLQLPNPGDPSLVEWQSQNGEFIIRLVSSNLTTSGTSVLFSCTSRPPDRIWFESVRAEPLKSK